MLRLLLLLLSFTLSACFSSPTLHPKHSDINNTDLVKPEHPSNLRQDVVHGQLSNGFTYYIHKHNVPANRIELRLAVKVGSLQDLDNQNGVAHFVEHMAFNGTKHFPKNQVITAMEKMGMSFGSHSNAVTNFNKTVYRLTVPTDNPDNIHTSLTIMKDWAESISFDNLEVEKERGIILEEWRNQNEHATKGINKVQREALWNNSRYLDHLAVGNPAGISHITSNMLKQFYHKWYTPSNMALIVVGDVTIKDVEALITTKFGAIANKSNAKQKSYNIPARDKIHSVIYSDKQQTSSVVRLMLLAEKREYSNIKHIKPLRMKALFNYLLNERLKKLSLSDSAPFFEARSYSDLLADKTQVHGFTVKAKHNEIEGGYWALLKELQRVKQHGFTATELAHYKQAIVARLDAYLLNSKGFYSGKFAEQLTNHFLFNKLALSPEQQVNEQKRTVQAITLEELNTFASALISIQRGFEFVLAPEALKSALPTAQKLKEIRRQTKELSTAPYRGTLTKNDLMIKQPKAGYIVSETENEELGFVSWQLSNGAVVHFKKTDFEPDYFIYKAIASGGTSMIADELYRNALAFSAVMNNTGVATYDINTLGRFQTEHQISLEFGASRDWHYLYGGGVVSELESFLKLNYLRLVSPRFNDAIVQRHKDNVLDYQAIRKHAYNERFNDEAGVFYWQDHFRSQPWRVEHATEISSARLNTIHQQWFSNATNFEYFFVGNLEKATLKQHVATYLASLPATGDITSNVEHHIMPISGKHRFIKHYATEQRAHVKLRRHQRLEKTSKVFEQELAHFVSITNVKLREVLREDFAGVYGVRLNAYVENIQAPRLTMEIAFTCEPDRAEELINITNTTLATLASEPITQNYLDNERQRWLKQRKVIMKNNHWILNRMAQITDTKNSYITLREERDVAENFTKEQFQKVAKKITNLKNMSDIILLPKNGAKP